MTSFITGLNEEGSLPACTGVYLHVWWDAEVLVKGGGLPYDALQVLAREVLVHEVLHTPQAKRGGPMDRT